jgi:hypothetical protein
MEVEHRNILDPVIHNPHPTDVLLDTSIFSIDRLPLVREMLLHFAPILLNPIRSELEDLKKKPRLESLRDLVFADGALNTRFRSDDRRVLAAYPRFSYRYINLLRWRRDAINVATRRAARETGQVPVGKARTRLIQELISEGLASETIRLANKECRAARVADEVLAVFAVISPIITGRDCFLYTADRDVFDQVVRMSEMLFDDYGAYLIAKDFQNDDGRYSHRHPYRAPIFIGDAIAVGRAAHPDYLLPPPSIINTCATVVVDVTRLQSFTWISARNIEPAISFQDGDPLGRKGDPGGGNSIIFSLPDAPEKSDRCREPHHFGIGKPSYLKLSSDKFGPIPSFDLFRAIMVRREIPRRQSRIVTPFADHQKRLLDRAAAAKKRR